MRAFGEIFGLEFRAAVRSRALAILAVLSTAWMFAMPFLVKSDGSVEGARMMYARYSLGGVFALLVVTLVASAAGSLAKDRAAKRLQLTLVRPVRYFTVALGRTVALTAVGAAVLALAAAVLAARSDLSRGCDHVIAPVLESPREEAERMYEGFMHDPDTSEEVKKADRRDVIRILEQRSREHYLSIPTNAVADWTFRLPRAPGELAVRLRFTNLYDVREDVAGDFLSGGLSGSVSNVTKTVVRVPLTGPAGAVSDGRVAFVNRGRGALMLRPRRDIHLLAGADSFGANLARTWLELVALLAMSIAFSVFLGAALGRSTAVFTALTVLTIAVISPGVIEECPYEIDTARGDRIGLALTRFAEAATRPFSSVEPLERLAADECVEWGETLRVLAVDGLLLPLLFALLSAAVLPRRQEGL